MPDVCEICGQPLRHGRFGNFASCVVCHIHICITCHKYGFCPPHYNALSPRGQEIIKRAASRHRLFIMIIFFVILFIGLGFVGFHVVGFPPILIVPWFLVDCVIMVVLVLIDKAWVISVWKTNLASPTPIPTSWHCEACGFENPTITQTCGQCGRNKSVSLRIA